MSDSEVALIRDDQEQFYRTHVRWLLRLALIRCENLQWAQDLVQETFIKLFRKWPERRAAIQDLPGYAARTLHNCFLDDLRRRNARPPTKFVDDPDQLPAALADLDNDCTDVDDQVRAAVRRLPSQQREVVRHVYYEDLSMAETARVMRLGPATVHNYHSLAKKQLREELAHLAPPAKERHDGR